MRAVALVDEDDVEVLGRDRRVVDDRQRLLAGPASVLELRALLLLGVELRLALEHRVEPLDGGDHDLARRADGVRGEPLDVVELGELAVVVGGPVAWNSFSACSPRLPRSTRNSTRRAPPNLISR